MSGTCSHRADSSKRCTSTALVTTQMRLATVSLCVLCETAGAPGVRTAAAAARHEHALLDEVGVARSRPTQARKAPRRGTKQKSIIECSFRLFIRCSTPTKSTIRFRVEWSICVEGVEHSVPSRPKQRLSRTFQDAGSAGWRVPFRPREDSIARRKSGNRYIY